MTNVKHDYLWLWLVTVRTKYLLVLDELVITYRRNQVLEEEGRILVRLKY